mgnify:FL=1
MDGGASENVCGLRWYEARHNAVRSMQRVGGAPAPAEGGLDGAIAARRYCKDSVVSGILELQFSLFS